MRRALVLAFGVSLLVACVARPTRTSLPTLTHVADIQRLSAAEAARGYGTQLEGTVAFAEGPSLYLCDTSGCVAVQGDVQGMQTERNPVVRLSGETGFAEGRHVVRHPSVRVIGQVDLAEAVPPPTALDDVLRGSVDAQLASVTGDVRAARQEGGDQIWELVTADGRRVEARTRTDQIQGCAYPALGGARVRMLGIAVPTRSAAGERNGLRLLVAHCGFIRILQDAAGEGTHDARPPLTRISDVRALSADEAALAHPVRVTGVVTFCDSRHRQLFVQDETGGIYVSAWRHLFDLRPGQRVTVAGQSEPGLYSPIIDQPHLRVVGEAPLPAPLRIAAADDLGGGLDSQRVELEGFVRDVTEQPNLLVLTVTSPAGRFLISVPRRDGPQALPVDLVDARVRLRGVCAVLLNSRRQRTGFKIWMPSLDDMTILEPGPPDPFAAATTPLENVMRFSSRERGPQRLKVRGILTLQQPGEALYVQDGRSGLRIENRTAPTLAPGDIVEAVGYPTAGVFSPMLTDTVVRTAGRAAPVEPIAMSPEEALRGDFDGVLVRVQGRVVGHVSRAMAATLTLQDRSYVIHAQLVRGEGNELDDLAPGTVVEATGVCVIRTTDAQQSIPQAFEILLRQRSDIHVRHAPPWWTRGRILTVLAAMGAVLLAGLGWVRSLRGTVSRQTEVIREKLAREAVLSERSRIAREIHDGLAQAVAAVSIHLEGVRSALPPGADRAQKRLETTRALVRDTLAEASRSIWDVQPPAEPQGLPAALGEMIGRFGADAPIELTVKDPARAVSAATEYHVVRVAQEAVANAVRHAQGSHIHVELGFPEDKIVLRVLDDGCGFDSAQIGSDISRSPGMLGMRQRASILKADLAIRSTPGWGTEVSLEVPLEVSA